MGKPGSENQVLYLARVTPCLVLKMGGITSSAVGKILGQSSLTAQTWRCRDCISARHVLGLVGWLVGWEVRQPRMPASRLLVLLTLIRGSRSIDSWYAVKNEPSHSLYYTVRC